MSNDVTHETLTHCYTHTFIYDNQVVEMAKDAVKGHFEDYYFFQYDDNEYVLVFSDDMESYGMGISAYDTFCVVFKRVNSSVTVNDRLSLSGTITEIGTPPKVDDVSLTGSVSRNDDSCTWEIYYVIADDINISNVSNMAYSSTGNFPRLQEGVTYYAFAAFCLALGIIGFRLLDFIFKRIY